MRRFWGRNDLSAAPRFTRDDDQILALNYENLCDGDYLQRLFVSDPFNSKDTLGGVMSEANRGSASNTESALLNPEIAEDIILFGDSVALGKQFYHKRLQRELQQSNKFYDSIFLQISRQVMVYEHMAMVMVRRCTDSSQDAQPAESSSAAAATKQEAEKPMAFSALGCCLRMIRSTKDWKVVRSAHLKSMTQILMQFLDPALSQCLQPWRDVESSAVFNQIRVVLLQGVQTLLSADFLPLLDWNKSQFEEEVRRPLYGIFGLLMLGIISKNADDLMIATNFLSLFVLLVEERTEDFLRRLKGEASHSIILGAPSLAHPTQVSSTASLSTTATAATTAATMTTATASMAASLPASASTGSTTGGNNARALPAKVPNKVRQQITSKGNSQRGPFGSAKSCDVEEVNPQAISPREFSRDLSLSEAPPSSSLMSSSCPLPATTTPSVTADPSTSTAATSSSTSGRLPSHGSGNKLWDKALPPKGGSFEKDKDGMLKKPLAKTFSKPVSETTPKLLHEVVDSKEGRTAAGGMSPMVVQMALVDMPGMTVASSSPKGQRNQGPASSVPGGQSSAMASIGSALSQPIPGPGDNKELEGQVKKRVERQVQEAVQAVCSLPASVLASLQVYRHYLSPGGSTASATSSLPSPGRKALMPGGSSSSASGKGKEIAPLRLSSSSSISSPRPALAQPLPSSSPPVSQVYSCGQNSYGELGLGDVAMRKSFARVTCLDDKDVVSLGAGNEHSIFVTYGGKLITAGYNDNGQCGLGTTQQVRQPTVVPALEDEEIHQVHVYNGCEHTIAVTREGKVYAFGYNYRGQLGLGSTTAETVPRPLRALLSRKVLLAACSYHHTVFLCSDGTVFSCGRNDSGQLGHGDTVDKKTPQAILTAPKHIVSLSCGQFHTLACTQQGVVYACGKNDYGQLGMEGISHQKVLSKVNLPADLDPIHQVSCGYYHTLVLSASGMVGGFGRNDYGQLGLGHAQPKVYLCTVINGLRDKLVVMIATGCYHSVTVTVNGMLYVFGRNNHGQLATGDMDERHVPHPVDDFIGQHVVQVAAGFYHTLVLLSEGKDNAKKESPATYLKTLGTIDYGLAEEGEGKGQDEKHLAELFKKDLSLILGGEEDNILLASLERDSAERMRKEKIPSPRGRGGRGGTRSSCRDLLSLLMQNLHCLSLRTETPLSSSSLASAQKASSDPDTLVGLSATISSLSMLLLTAWENLQGASFSLGMGLPLAVEEAGTFLSHVMAAIPRMIARHKSLFQSILKRQQLKSSSHPARGTEKTWPSSSLRGDWMAVMESFRGMSIFDDELREDRNEETRSAVKGSRERRSLTQLLVSCFQSSLLPNLDSSSSSSASLDQLEAHLAREFDRLRHLLLSIYLSVCSHAKYRELRETYTPALIRCLVQVCDVDVSDPQAMVDVIAVLAPRILRPLLDTSSSSSSLSEDSLTSHLRLLSSLGTSFHRHEEVISLFHHSPATGYALYHHYVSLYNHFSRHCIEKRLQGAASIRNVDIRRLLTVLELSLTTMSKALLPLLFSPHTEDNRDAGGRPSSSSSPSRWREQGLALVVDLIVQADDMLSRIIASSLSDDSLSFLRYGSLLPSVLPSILLYCITFAKRGVEGMDVLRQPLRGLIVKLQAMGKFELSLARGHKSSDKKTSVPSSSSSPLPHKEGGGGGGGGDADRGANSGVGEAKGGEDDASNEATAEESLTLRRETHGISWWFRLLKLAVTLSSRLVTLDIKRLRDQFSGRRREEEGRQEVPSHLSRDVLWTFLRHPAWRHLTWDASQLTSLVNVQEMTARMEQDTASLAASPIISERAAICRSQVQQEDAVYRMLYTSTRSAFSVQLLHTIEENLVGIITFDESSSVVVDRRGKFMHAFRLATQVIKRIFSQRSLLVLHGEGLGWVEVLLLLAKVMKVLCDFVQMARRPLFLYHPLLLPRLPPSTTSSPSRAQRRWRQVTMVVMCVQRWCRCLVSGSRRLEEDLVDWVVSGVSVLTDHLTKVPSPTVLVQRLVSIFQTLSHWDQATSQAANGLASVTHLLEEVHSITIRSDVLTSIAVSIRELSDLSEDGGCGGGERGEERKGERSSFDSTSTSSSSALSSQSASWLCCALNCASQVSRQQLFTSFTTLEMVVNGWLKSFPTQSSTLIELQALTSAIRLLEIMLWISPVHKVMGSRFTVLMATRLQLSLHDRYVSWASTGEERQPTKKGATIRDRNFAIKKCIFALLSYAQAYSIRLCAPTSSTSKSLHEVLQGHYQLMAYLQNVRYIESQIRFTEEAGNGSGAKADEGGAASSVLASPGSGNSVTAMASALHTTKSTPAASSTKKKFQDLVTKPMDFSKNNEGIHIAGEKLLSNSKTTEYSVAVWIYVKTRPASNKTALILGKFNHMEAWPLVSLKADGKIEVSYGTHSEMEKTTSEEAIALSTWTHLAIAIEPKKIKVFINAVADIQVTTSKMNNRATLFPLILGSCPSSLRTRVCPVREGFDGMMAQCRYYPRALSPIHVKIIFDHGPPETIDISAKVVYHLLASTKALLWTIDMEYSSDLIHKLADVCHTIFVTDTNRRNRLAALDLLHILLSKGCLTDLQLTGWRPHRDDPKLFSRTSLLACSFCGDFDSFSCRVLLYFLRLAGWNWLPFLLPAETKKEGKKDEDKDKREEEEECKHAHLLRELCIFSPLSPVHHNVVSQLPDAMDMMGGMEDRTSYQGVLPGELSFHVLSMVQTLIASHSTWKDAAAQVLPVLLRKYIQVLEGKNSSPTLVKVCTIDIVGCALLLGGIPSGGYLGTTVHNVFDDAEGRIVNIHPASHGATVLSNHPVTGELKASKVRLTDLTFQDDFFSSPVGDVVVRIQESLWETVRALGSRVALLSKDFLAQCHGDSPFLTKVLLKHLRPIESLVYWKLLAAWNMSPSSSSTICPSSALHAALPSLVRFASCAIETDGRGLIRPSSTDLLATQALAPITRCWFENSKYLESVSDKVVRLRFPAEAEEKSFAEFVNKHMGVALDQDHTEALKRCGEWGKAVVSLALFQSASESPSAEEIEYDVSESSLVLHRSSPPPIHGENEELADQEAQTALQLLHYIRWHVVQSCRKVMQAMSSSPFVDRLAFPDDLMFWAHLRPLSRSDKECLVAGTLQALVSPNQLWGKISTRLVSNGLSLDMTRVLATSIRYAVLSFLQPSSYKAEANLLNAIDFFPAMVCNLLYWIEFHDHIAADFDKIAYHILVVLLPSLPYYESEKLELLMLQVCVHVVRKLSMRIMEGSKPSTELLDLVRNTNFSLLRQTAQEQILKYKSHSFNTISSLAYNLTQLVSYMEIIQRRGSFLDYHDCLRAASSISSSTGSGKVSTSLAVCKMQCIETTPPKLLSVRSTTLEVDLSSCAATVLSHPQAVEVLTSLAGGQIVDANQAVVVEVALGIGPAGSDSVFETVYCGSSTKLLQSGLLPDCLYQMKCRAYVGGTPMTWSRLVEFRTEAGLLFSFDPLKSGPDIVLSEDQLTASYTGDDNWSTLLGNRSFNTGVTSWEIRVNQSSTAYLFIGVATSAADLNTFLGGCNRSWGFIGEQALYHNREKVKVYGEAFSSGDVIGVTLDLNLGTLSFSRNKKNLGIAFDKLYGDLFPAVAFYNLGQELQIIPTGFKTTCAQDLIPISPTRLSMDDVSLVNELVLCLFLRRPLSHRLAVMVAEHCNQWCASVYVRCRAVSQKDVFLAVESPLLKRFGLVVGERVRTYYGVAEVAGVAYNRVWFRVNAEGEVWFFTIQQIQEGRAKRQLFYRCSYDVSTETMMPASSPSLSTSIPTAATAPLPPASHLSENHPSHSTTAVSTTTANANASATGVLSAISFDAATVLDLLEPSKWTEEMDSILLTFYVQQAQAVGVEPWHLSSEQLYEHFRGLQQQLTRVVLASADLSHRWGIAGPKRKAVIARLGLLRALNQLLEMYLPFFISDHHSKPFSSSATSATSTIAVDDFVPLVETFPGMEKVAPQRQAASVGKEDGRLSDEIRTIAFESPWPAMRLSWDRQSFRTAATQEAWMGPLHALRRRIFCQIKLKHFIEVIRKTTTRPMKTDDDYDYPENLPHVKINRLKSFRAREAAELMQISGEDLMPSSMFCQLHKELRRHSEEKLRISYTHPMDDGQSRSFKIKFEGEGVDDYGGPYREIFGQICAELQLLYPNPRGTGRGNGRETGGSRRGGGGSGGRNGRQRPGCFLPLLMPAPNWTADGDIAERYVYIFQPSVTSDLKMDLILFLGQLIGMAIRSRITLDLAFPSMIWKVLVGESLDEHDLASFDQPAFDFVQRLRAIHTQFLEIGQQESRLSEESVEALRYLTWTAVQSDGQVVELCPGGAHRPVQVSELCDFLTRYVAHRLEESKLALRMLRRGLTSILPESALSLLSCEDFQRLVCGSKVIDIDRLQMNTEYDDDISPSDPHILNFWEVLRSFDEAEKSMFLKFVWARPSLPPDGIEFTQKMRVLSAAGDDPNIKHDQFLPKAHTCFFSINLPKYSTKEIMTEKLRYAIFNCTEMDGDFRTTEVEVAGWDATLHHTEVQANAMQLAQDLV